MVAISGDTPILATTKPLIKPVTAPHTSAARMHSTRARMALRADVHRIEHDDGYHTGGSRLEAHRQIDVARDHHQAQAQTHRAVHGHVIDDVVEAFAVIGNEDKCRRQDQNQDQDGVIVLEQPDLLLSAQVAGDHHFLFHSLTPLSSASTSRDKTTSMMAPMMTHWRYWDILSAVKPADNTP